MAPAGGADLHPQEPHRPIIGRTVLIIGRLPHRLEPMGDTSKTVHQALLALEALRDGGPGTVTELARRLGLSRTVVTRLVATLEQHDLVRRTGDGIDLGFGLLDLATGLAVTLRETARPFLQDLAIRFHETAVLAVADNDMAVAVDQVVPDRRLIRVHYRAGTRHSLADAAHGRAMLAFSPATAVRPGAVPHPSDLEQELAAVRRRGYAVSHDELETGVAGLAAPVLDSNGAAVASVGVVAPVTRLPAERTLGPAVVDAAERITAALADTGARFRPAVRTSA